MRLFFFFFWDTCKFELSIIRGSHSAKFVSSRFIRFSCFWFSVSGVFISEKRFYNPVSLAVALRTCAKIVNAKPRIFHSAF